MEEVGLESTFLIYGRQFLKIDIKNDFDLENVMLKYEFAKKVLETEIEILVREFNYNHGYTPVEHIKTRIKSESSIKKKLEKKGYTYNAENIIKHVSDVVGIRIVCSFLSDVYDLVYLIEHSTNIIIQKRKDYIAHPKKTGYSSYHLIVLVPIHLQEKVEFVEAEIQIRTMAMDFWATLDHKIQYKFDKEIPIELQNQMAEYSNIVNELDKKMLELNELVVKYNQEF